MSEHGESPQPVTINADVQPPRGLGRAGPVAIWATVVPIIGACLTIIVGPFAAAWLRDSGPGGIVYFTLAFMVLGAVALAPTYATSVIAGWTFGFRQGFPAVIIGTVGGATLCYIGARRLLGPRVIDLFQQHPKWDIVRKALMVESMPKAMWIVFLLRLSPVLPFGTTNVLLATTGVRLPVYVVGTLLGLAPRTCLVALAAAGAERLDFAAARSWWMLAAGIVATVLCIGVLAIAGKHALDRATARAANSGTHF